MSKTRRFRVDTAGFLANLLTGYEATSILREQTQNADDACHIQGLDGFLRVTFADDRLIFENPSVLTDEDWDRLVKPASRGKWQDAEQTGEFGVGFWSILHVTDAPIVTSATTRLTIDPLAEGDLLEETIQHPIVGTRFELPYRVRQSATGTRLAVNVVDEELRWELEKSFLEQLASLVVFTRSLAHIEVVCAGGERIVAKREVQHLAPQLDLLTVTGGSNENSSVRHLRVSGEIADPPEGRHGRIEIALPIDDDTPGRVFCTFPTETPTGLAFSVNAHFFAAQDRRSIAQAGSHGAWNTNVFEAAGRILGRSLEHILAADLRVPFTQRLRWFVAPVRAASEIRHRAELCLEALDDLALDQNVVPDRDGKYRPGRELRFLDEAVEPIIGAHMADTIPSPDDETVRDVFERWGVRAAGRSDVARWLRETIGNEVVEKERIPVFLRQLAHHRALLDYCEAVSSDLADCSLTLASDGRLYPLGSSSVRRASSEMHDLVQGLALPLASSSLNGTIAWRLASPTDAAWLRTALIDSRPALVGKKVPLRNVGCFSKLDLVKDALRILTQAGLSLRDVPLGIEPTLSIQPISGTTIVGLPRSKPARAAASALLERVGSLALHPDIDEVELFGPAITRWGPPIVAKILEDSRSWDPFEDTVRLLTVMRVLHEEESLPQHVIDSARSAVIWPASDGSTRSLDQLFLPPPGASTRPLSGLVVHERILSGTVASSTLRDVLKVDLLDVTEEVVQQCERASGEPAQLRDLLAEVARHGKTFSERQKERLRRAAFVPCRDRTLRAPAHVLVTEAELPSPLRERVVHEYAAENQILLELLAELGAKARPTPEDLVATARAIAGKPPSDADDDAGLLLWRFLERDVDAYDDALFDEIGQIAWMTSEPGPERRRPADLMDPRYRFAALLYPVPIKVGTPAARFRDRLHMKGTLSLADYVALGREAASREINLDWDYWVGINRLAGDTANHVSLASLRDVKIIRLKDRFASASELVSAGRAPIWGHLRKQAPQALLDTYPDIMSVWFLTDDDDVPWQEHADVLEELADQPMLDERDQALALARVTSLADACMEEELRIPFLATRPCVLTSLGVKTPSAALRADMPLTIIQHLEEHLPIAAEQGLNVGWLLDELGVPSLRQRARLVAEAVGTTEIDHQWAPRLRLHKANVLRFLHFAAPQLAEEVSTAWPPIVRRTQGLIAKLVVDGRVLKEWEEAAFLAHEDGELCLYVRTRSQTTLRDIVNAMTAHFGIPPIMKATLLSVLQGSDAEAGAMELDYAEVPEHSIDLLEVELGEVAELDDVPPMPQEDSLVPVGEDADVDEPAPTDVERAPEWDEGEAEPEEEPELMAPPQEPLAEELEPFIALPLEPAPPRANTDFVDLMRRGYEIEDVEREPVEEADLAEPEAEPDGRTSIRLVLSFYAVQNGLLPLRIRDTSRLAGPTRLHSVILFGDSLPARQVRERWVRVDGAAELFADRQVVAGTVVHLYPGPEGVIEAQILPQPHQVEDVWMLEINDDGELVREKLDAVSVLYETDGPLYKAERRWEDLEALYAEADRSCLDLLIKAFELFGSDGLTAHEAWEAVAMFRLFSPYTIQQHLSEQDGLFEMRDGLWFKTGNVVQRERRRAERHVTPTTRRTSSVASLVSRARQVARELGDLLHQLDPSERAEIVSLLGLGTRPSSDRLEFERACRSYVESGDRALLEAIARDIASDPSTTEIAINVVDDLDSHDPQKVLPLLDIVEASGTAGAVARSQKIRAQLAGLVAIESLGTDPITRVERALEMFFERQLPLGSVEKTLEDAYLRGLPDDVAQDSRVAFDRIVRLERSLRRARAYQDTTEEIAARRGRAIAALEGQVGGAHIHADLWREFLKLVVLLLQERHPLDLVEELCELGKHLRQAPGQQRDALEAFRLGSHMARAHTLAGELVNYVHERAAEESSGAVSDDMVAFTRAWCEIANLEYREQY